MKIAFNKFADKTKEFLDFKDISLGDNTTHVSLLEGEFVSCTGAKYALATSCGTSALHLSMLALDLKRGDKIVCSVNSFPNVPEVVRHFDAEPVFIDIDENSYSIDLNLLEGYLQDNMSKKLKAVIVSHVAGQSIDLERLYSISKIYNVKIIEDANDAFGSMYNGVRVGSVGADITCFDFSPHMKKNICNGGMFVTSNKEFYERAKLLSNHGINNNSDGLEYIYDVVDIGNDYSMSELDAIYIRAQIKDQKANIKRQQEIAKMYSDALEGVEHISIPDMSNKEHPFSLYIIKVDKNRDSFALELKNAGIETGLHYIPLHLLSYYKSKYSFRVNDFPVALRVFQQTLSLPIYSGMSDKDVKFVIEKIKTIVKTRV